MRNRLFGYATALVLGFAVAVPDTQAQNAGGFGNTGLSSTSLFDTGANTNAAGTGATAFGSALGGFDPNFGAAILGANAATGGLGNTGGFGGINTLGGGFGGGGFGGGFGGGGFGGGAFGGGAFGGNTRGGNFQNQNGQNQSTLRATVKIGFAYAGPTSTARSTTINARLARIPMPANAQGVRVEMRGRTAVLVGTAESAADVDLITRLLSLEPGIDAVENQLVLRTIGPATADPSDAPEPPSPVEPSAAKVPAYPVPAPGIVLQPAPNVSAPIASPNGTPL